MIGEVNLTLAVVAGLVGAGAMALASYMFNAVGIPMVDFGRMLATKILRYHSHGTRLGLVLHLLNGAALALVYALVLMRLLPGWYWLLGLGYGAVLWLFLMVVVLPMQGDGLFGLKSSPSIIPSALALHLLYGLILGLAIR